MKRGIRITPDAIGSLRLLRRDFQETDEDDFWDDEDLITHYRDILFDAFSFLGPLLDVPKDTPSPHQNHEASNEHTPSPSPSPMSAQEAVRLWMYGVPVPEGE